MLSTIEIFLTPISFALLFLLMLLYWGQTAFFSYIKYKIVTSLVFVFSLFCVTFLLLLRWVDSGHLPLSNLYESLLFLSWSFLIIQAVFQISTISETLLWSNIQIAHKSNRKSEASPLTRDAKETKDQINVITPLKVQNDRQEIMDILAVILTPMSLLTYTFAYLNLPKEMQKATALVPALQSNWLMMHVSVMILSYAALISGCILSITYLLYNLITSSTLSRVKTAFREPIVEDSSTKKSKDLILSNSPYTTDVRYKTRQELPNFSDTPVASGFTDLAANTVDGASRMFGRIHDEVDFINLSGKNGDTDIGYPSANQTNMTSRLALSEKLDNYSYRMIGIGFPLLTIGILSGAVWANSAWGSYWSWDPKETWALITWLFFAIYLHARITRGWSGKKAAIIATIAFFVVWFCFLGVNLLGTGLHSYGWFTK